METRVLTLFDDEEFFRPEPPKEKPKKEKATKSAIISTDEVIPDSPLTESIIPVIQKEADVPDAKPTAALQDDTEPELDIDEMHFLADSETPLIAIALEEHSVGEEMPDAGYADSNGVAQENAMPEDMPNAAETNIIFAKETIFTGLLEVPENTDESVVEISLNESKKEVDAHNEEVNIAEELLAANEQDTALNQQILSELIQLDYTALLQQDFTIDTAKASIKPKQILRPVDEPNDIEECSEEAFEEDFVFEEVAPLPEWNLDKKYYTIGEVSQLFGVNTSHIRFWTNEFKLKPRTNRKGDRLYTPKDIAELRLIHHLVKVKKHTIKGAREKLKAEKAVVNNKLDLKESLIDLKETLMKIRAKL